MDLNKKKVIIVGAGPAGLSAAYYILKESGSDVQLIILEESGYIGGISRTYNYNGNRIDIGGHRFFTKSDEIKKFWSEIFTFPDDGSNALKEHIQNDDKCFLKRKRVSRIYFKKNFFEYPVKCTLSTFINFGIIDSLKIIFGYLYSCIYKRKEKSLEDFYINRFGLQLYKCFFEDYTTKVWGLHPSKISSEWGSQRIKGLSLFKCVQNYMNRCINKKNKIETSLIEEFLYPKYGPGQFYEEVARKIVDMGGKIIFNNRVEKFNFDNSRIVSVQAIDKENYKHIYNCDYIFSSMPIKDLILGFNCKVDDRIKNIACELPYRDFITVGLLVKKLTVMNKFENNKLIPDCWIYVQDKSVNLGRIQIFNNWSPYMVRDYNNSVFLGLEYFCSENDDLWNMQDKDFVNMAADELYRIGFINKNDVLDSIVIRMKKAYPSYFGSYKYFAELRKYINSIENLYCIGRNGQHRYNNMDHSAMTGIEAAKLMIKGGNKDSLWDINTEKDYHEIK